MKQIVLARLLSNNEGNLITTGGGAGVRLVVSESDIALTNSGTINVAGTNGEGLALRRRVSGQIGTGLTASFGGGFSVGLVVSAEEGAGIAYRSGILSLHYSF